MANETNACPGRVLTSQPELPPLPTLDPQSQRETPDLVRARLCIREERTRLLDPDNLYGSVKSLLDGLVQAGLIPGDSQKDISLEVEQVKVAHLRDQKTVIEIEYPQ